MNSGLATLEKAIDDNNTSNAQIAEIIIGIVTHSLDQKTAKQALDLAKARLGLYEDMLYRLNVFFALHQLAECKTVRKEDLEFARRKFFQKLPEKLRMIIEAEIYLAENYHKSVA